MTSGVLLAGGDRRVELTVLRPHRARAHGQPERRALFAITAYWTDSTGTNVTAIAVVEDHSQAVAVQKAAHDQLRAGLEPNLEALARRLAR